jgi:glutamine synthetase
MTDLNQLIELIDEEDIRYIALQVVDLLGKLKMLWIPAEELPKAFEQGIGVDGSALRFVSISKSDLVLKPDLNSFRVYPWSRYGYRVAGVMCDLYYPDTLEGFEGAPRRILKRAIAHLKAQLGDEIDFYVSFEPEFFLFTPQDSGDQPVKLHDSGSYFSPPPLDKGYDLREEICESLRFMGIQVVKSHHEVPPGKHEINIKYSEALSMADTLQFLKTTVKKLASDRGFIASFMPKPFHGQYGAGMHTHLSLLKANGEINLFYSADAPDGLSDLGRYFIGGLLKHAKALAAITNPTVNSYKRLLPGWEAPVYIVWSRYNRSALLRIPFSSPSSTRLEYRPTDGSCNPYLALAALLEAGLDGIREEVAPPPPVEEDVYHLSNTELERRNIQVLPANLQEALTELENDEVIKKAIEPATEAYLALKKREWEAYTMQVHDWEREQYLDV